MTIWVQVLLWLLSGGGLTTIIITILKLNHDKKEKEKDRQQKIKEIKLKHQNDVKILKLRAKLFKNEEQKEFKTNFPNPEETLKQIEEERKKG